MDALIRRVQMAALRTRLSDSLGSTEADRDAYAEAKPSAESQLEALREEIEAQVRSELASHVRDLYDSEREQARAEGREAAVSEANAAAAQDLAEMRDEHEARLESALFAMQAAHQGALSKLESSVGEVAFAAVCRLVGQFSASQTFVLGVLQQTCAQLRADTSATARLHPRDIETLRDLLHDQRLQVRSLGLKLVPDESLELGGCVIEADSGQYDGGLDSQLRRLHGVMTGTSTTERVNAVVSAVGSAAPSIQAAKG
jgi:flagellar assembly protein FliH